LTATRVQVIERIADLRAALAQRDGAVLVPTMGNLHDGHLSLVRLAAAQGAPVVASIFVNRLQFGANEDFDRYPRTFERDCALLSSSGCELVFAPRETDLYPAPQACFVQPRAGLAEVLEGRSRPGFFIGVCTVVLKLFNAVRPRVAVFGKKDYQQVLVVRDMIAQFALPIEMVAGETIREPDGLALSSRNSYLSAAERAQAPELHAALRAIDDAIRAGRRDWTRLELDAERSLAGRGWQVDYVAIRRRDDLGEPGERSALVALAAAKLGGTRLIDNLELGDPAD
jgi:pantoate--beta-alanine ligase